DRIQHPDRVARRHRRDARVARRLAAGAAARALRTRLPGQGHGDAARGAGDREDDAPRGAARRGGRHARDRPRISLRSRGARRLPPGARMRILVLTPTFLPVVGGAELVLLEVYRRLARRHDVRVLTPWLAESLRRDHGSSEYDGLVNFAVERYEDRVTLMRVRG